MQEILLRVEWKGTSVDVLLVFWSVWHLPPRPSASGDVMFTGMRCHSIPSNPSSEIFLCTSEFHVCEKENTGPECHNRKKEGTSGLPPSSEVAICILARYVPPTGCAGSGWAGLDWTELGWVGLD